MKKSIFLLAFLLAIGIQHISAQVPGYQGKRFSVGYNASSFFYFRPVMLSDGVIGIVEATRLSYKTEFNVNYTVSRKVSMGLSYYFGNQNAYFHNTYVQLGYSNNSMEPKDGIAPCKLAMYELHFQFFRNNFIAPTGLYHQISIGIVKYGLGTPDNQLTIYPIGNGGSSVPVVLDGPTEKFTCIKLGYAIGKTNPIGHNLYINTSFGINFFRGGDSDYIKGDLTKQNYILSNFNRALRVQNFAEIKIGLGWLAF